MFLFREPRFEAFAALDPSGVLLVGIECLRQSSPTRIAVELDALISVRCTVFLRQLVHQIDGCKISVEFRDFARQPGEDRGFQFRPDRLGFGSCFGLCRLEQRDDFRRAAGRDRPEDFNRVFCRGKAGQPKTGFGNSLEFHGVSRKEKPLETLRP